MMHYSVLAIGQEQWNFRGIIESNINFFREDSLIGASGIPQYNNNDIGGELWVDLHASYKGFKAGIRLDAFRNSNLLNPNDSYSAEGLGRFYVSQDYGRFSGQLGYIYDQIGSGIIFRSYETRPQLIDNALIGGKGSIQISDAISINGYYGRQKVQFNWYDSFVRGLSLDGYFQLGKEGDLSISPGIGYVNRVLSSDNMDNIVDVLRTYVDQDRVIPRFNTYLGTIFNTLSYKSIQWYVEAAYKTPELFFDPNAIRTEITGRKAFGKYVKAHGTVFYSSVSLGLQNLGITLEAKRTENFNFRADPLLRQNNGLLSFIPPMNRQSTYRLLSRYNPATQELSEMAWQLDIKNKINDSWSWQFNLSDIYTLEKEPLFQEIFLSLSYKQGRKVKINSGIQFLRYNQEVYEVKPDVPVLKAVTPFLDVLYKISSRKSIRAEIQYMNTSQDYGSWIFGLAEIGLGKHWQFEVSGMYNSSPGPQSPVNTRTGEKKKIIYPTLGTTFTAGSKRFSLRYVKQVEGVVCTGGICRLEPAFSGFRFNTYVQI